MINNIAALAIRAALTIVLLWIVWQNSHWSVVVALAAVYVGMEIQSYMIKKLLHDYKNRMFAATSRFDSAINLCRMEIEAIEKEAAAQPAAWMRYAGFKDADVGRVHLVKIRMNTIYGNLRLAMRSGDSGISGFMTLGQSRVYKAVRDRFRELEKEHGFDYDDDEL